MNGKKAKELRRQLKAHDAYKKEADYKPIVHKRKIYTTDIKTGLPRLEEVERIQLINKSKYTYRRAKKAYKKGEIVV